MAITVSMERKLAILLLVLVTKGESLACCIISILVDPRFLSTCNRGRTCLLSLVNYNKRTAGTRKNFELLLSFRSCWFDLRTQCSTLLSASDSGRTHIVSQSLASRWCIVVAFQVALWIFCRYIP